MAHRIHSARSCDWRYWAIGLVGLLAACGGSTTSTASTSADVCSGPWWDGPSPCPEWTWLDFFDRVELHDGVVQVVLLQRSTPCRLTILWRGTRQGEIAARPERAGRVTTWRAEFDLPEPDAMVLVKGRWDCKGGFTGRVPSRSVAGPEAWQRVCALPTPRSGRSPISYHVGKSCGWYVLRLRQGHLPALPDADPDDSEPSSPVLLDRCTDQVIADAGDSGIRFRIPHFAMSGGLTEPQRLQFLGSLFPEECRELERYDAIVLEGLKASRTQWTAVQTDVMEKLRRSPYVESIQLELCPE